MRLIGGKSLKAARSMLMPSHSTPQCPGATDWSLCIVWLGGIGNWENRTAFAFATLTAIAEANLSFSTLGAFFVNNYIFPELSDERQSRPNCSRRAL
jgi:hypothetical protein